MDYRRVFLSMVVLTAMTICINILYILPPRITNSAMDEKHTREFKSFTLQNINCKRILEGDENEMLQAKSMVPKSFPDDETVLRHTTNCVQFRTLYGYDTIPNTEEEQQFPIAFNILLYKDLAQVEILLRAIYRPQNYYCLHVDGFSPDHVHKAAKALADCFDNVFIVSKTENIVYESFQRLQADINCMADHLVKPDWKYLINLPGQELPLKTNLQIVNILKALNNNNSIECLTKQLLSYRFYRQYIYQYGDDGKHYKIIKTKNQNPNLPHGMTIVKGSAYAVFTHQFVNYVVNNQTAKDLLEWCRGVLSPDEYYWSTLNHNPHLKVPGSYKEKCTSNLLSTYANWQIGKTRMKCAGRILRNVCIFSVGDLPTLVNRKELFANKFELEYSYTAIQCLSEWLHNETLSSQPIDEQFYKSTF
ncbi:beta-1,3-galactosyl-O-glycosyl-glycoprotein beta-1,6-N-acetylglucosaminyltransferase [Patella vulgata]|uniref:beta-1,3-galactosyl-O-glycosyl-glycoprotein beta-1,6-N-acetylglucosaminyltransferase n=1 Tax=Patella vulgata TaxID=6465 RepID=UPI00217F6D9A|nr:beta-1,3-galactosyl-O-glycosyl-glycoprotein beta-1,6-N-acetylglucosaminyltransferase [Patella vulgata]